MKRANTPLMVDVNKNINRTGYAHIAFSAGSEQTVNELVQRLQLDGYTVINGPNTNGMDTMETASL